jgi:hypothetical protein
MTIEAAFQKLTAKLTMMREEFESLGLTVIEDRPANDQVLLVDRLGDLTTELCGWAEEALASAFKASQAAEHPANLHAARTALAEANLSVIRLEHRFFEDAIAHHAIDGLRRASRARGGEWLSWSQSVVQALNACRSPLRELDEMLLETWAELADRLGSRSVSVQTTSIGQQIAASPAAAARRMEGRAAGGAS